jgi:hypothetical protein
VSGSPSYSSGGVSELSESSTSGFRKSAIYVSTGGGACSSCLSLASDVTASLDWVGGGCCDSAIGELV